MGLLNRYFKITRFYSFLKDTAFKGGYLIALFVAVVFLLDTFVVDINLLLSNLVESFSPLAIFSIFLISESILGLLPPEVFIAWASKSSFSYLYLFTLASISYLGGVISYFIGGRLFLIPAVKNYVEVKIAKHIVNLRKWGGVFVVLGAISPLPHSMVSMACGIIKYNFKHYLLWSLFRYIRFLVYALIIFQVF
ncbi:MAG: short-chain dehydrogenase [Flavobacteriales bacterium]|nr:short-chain dehydrogenase [Flavobacteriales bacterium]MBL6873544.1 short-chain dehydrogenase [Flavobacteriales bacterium]